MNRGRLAAAGLWTPVFAAGFALLGWAFLDILRVPVAQAQNGLGIVLVLAALALASGLASSVAFLRRLGFLLTAAAYFLAHALWLPLEVVPALAYVTLLLVFVEFRVLAARFAPLFQEELTPEERTKVLGTLGRAAVRLSATAAMAVLLPIFAGDLALAGTVPLTTIPSAIALAAGLVAVIVLLALLPTWTPESSPAESDQAKPN